MWHDKNTQSNKMSPLDTLIILKILNISLEIILWIATLLNENYIAPEKQSPCSRSTGTWVAKDVQL